MIRVFISGGALLTAVLLAACGVKAPPRPPLKPDTAGPAQPGPTDAAQPAPEPATCGACATPAPTPKTP